MLILPGLVFAYAMNSGTVFAGTDGLTTITKRRRANHGDRRDVADVIERKVRVERRIEGIRRNGQKKQVAVRRRSYDQFGGDIAAGARSVFDDDWLTEPFRQSLSHEARDDVGLETGR